MPKPTPTPLTPTLIAAHERLHPRLASLLKQVERVAARRPEQAVPEETLKLGRELCREAERLLGRAGRGLAVGPGRLDHAGLAVALGQAVVALEAFEAAHSGQSAKLGYAIWQVDGPPMPVTRLLPKGMGGKPIETRDPEADFHRRELYKLIMYRFKMGYDQGYRDAQAGKPPSAESAERIWDDLMEKEQGAQGMRGPNEPRPRVRYEPPPRHLVPEGARLSTPKERTPWR